MIENARTAVANGSADPEETKMATNGAEVKDDGNVVASGLYMLTTCLLSMGIIHPCETRSGNEH